MASEYATSALPFSIHEASMWHTACGTRHVVHGVAQQPNGGGGDWLTVSLPGGRYSPLTDDIRLGPVAGIWQVQRRALWDLVLVNIRGLPRQLPGCSMLRLMAESTDAREARAAIDALLADPAVLQSTKDGLLEELMKETIPSTPAERGSILERIRAEGREEERQRSQKILERIRAEGRQEGRQEGTRETLLSIARTRCDEAVIRELAAIEDVETLRRRVHALLGND
ncbi:MAG: hypothetical protein ABI333_13780 [bacterium]